MTFYEQSFPMSPELVGLLRDTEHELALSLNDLAPEEREMAIRLNIETDKAMIRWVLGAEAKE